MFIMSIVQEFKEFAVKGNAVELAVGIVIGTAFSALVKSLVDDVMMPPIGALISNVDFRDIFIALSTNADYPSIQAAKAAGVPTINIGIFLNAVLSFFLVSLALFLVVKAMNKLRRQKDTPTTKTCPECQSSIHIDAKRCPNCTTIFS
jgi:large conductance mechanosensitive channel